MTQATVVKRQILASKIAYKRSLNNEERLERELQRFFYKLKKEVLNALDQYWSDTLLLQGQVDLICAPVHEAHKEYYELLEKYIKREYRLGKAEGKRLVEIANSRAKTSHKSERIPFTPRLKKTNDLFGTLPSAEERLLNKTFTASERTLARVDSQISQILTDGYRNGQGINSVANDLTARFDQLTTWESKRIARTEIHNAHNTAVMDTYEDMGVEYTMWVTAHDDRVRGLKETDQADHVELDGEIIRVGDEYSNGLKYPGDTDGDLVEWINCRCANAPFVIPYGYMAPPFTPFRESDLVKVETKDPQQMMEEPQEAPQSADNSEHLWEDLAEKHNLEFVKYDGAELEYYDPKNDTPLRFYTERNKQWIDYTNSGTKEINLETILKEYDAMPDLHKAAAPEIRFVGDRGGLAGEFIMGTQGHAEIQIAKNAYVHNPIYPDSGNLGLTLRHECSHAIDAKYIYDMDLSKMSKDFWYSGNHKELDNGLYRKAVSKDRRIRKKTGGQNYVSEYARESGNYHEDFAEALGLRSYRDAPAALRENACLYERRGGEIVKVSYSEFEKMYPNRCKVLDQVLDNYVLGWG